MMRKTLSRRTLLRGIGGVAVALPMLDAMIPSSLGIAGKARADTTGMPPGRFVISYGGVSSGADGTDDDLLTPSVVGPGYETRRATRALDELGIHDDVSIVSGLVLPYANGEEPVPPAGRSRFYHGNTAGPQISGTRGPADRTWEAQGPSADQLVAEACGAGTAIPVLAYRVQPVGYVGTNNIGSGGRLSFYRDDDGSVRAVEPVSSPRLAYESLFTGFTPTDPAEAERALQLLGRRRSVLDLVRVETGSLMSRLGPADRRTLEEHFEGVRELERRLDAVDPTGGSCELLPHPGDDPPLGETIIEYEGAGLPYSTSGGYSNEDARADVLADLITMAFACDLSRAASFMITSWKCYMNMYQLSEARFEFDMHSGTHAGNQDAVSDAVNWHVMQWGKLVRKLKGKREIDGTTLLDHTALVLVLEGGHGFDPESTDGSARSSSHSTENMVVFVGGRTGGLAHGEHIVAPGAHPSSVVLAAMRAMRYPGALGEVSDVVPGLLR